MAKARQSPRLFFVFIRCVAEAHKAGQLKFKKCGTSEKAWDEEIYKMVLIEHSNIEAVR
jgi:hypothetical protein